MNTAFKQANFQLPEELLNELRATVGKREQSRFVSGALRKELQRVRQLKAIDETFGCWRDGEHPELANGIDKFVRSGRKSTRGNRTNVSSRD